MSLNNKLKGKRKRQKVHRKASKNDNHEWQWSKRDKAKIDPCGLEKDWKGGCERNETSWSVLF